MHPTPMRRFETMNFLYASRKPLPGDNPDYIIYTDFVAPMDHGEGSEPLLPQFFQTYGSDSFTSDQNQFLRNVPRQISELFHTDYPLGFSYGYAV